MLILFCVGYWIAFISDSRFGSYLYCPLNDWLVSLNSLELLFVGLSVVSY